MASQEAYLIRTRVNKMPYKHIAAHLQKTELACRLHYHQMSYGSNRRRRTDSISSCVSSYSTASGTQDNSFDLDSAQVSQSSPPESGSHSRAASTSESPQQSKSHVPILPKPQVHSAHAELNKSLRLDTSFVHNGIQSKQDQDGVDIARLRKLYETYRDSFWSMIATEYSKNQIYFSAHQLEQVVFESYNGSSSPYKKPGATPPTPEPSPQDYVESHDSSPYVAETDHGAGTTTPFPPGNGGFRAINRTPSHHEKESNFPARCQGRSPVEKCAVASLLTVEKEIWAPKQVSTV